MKQYEDILSDLLILCEKEFSNDVEKIADIAKKSYGEFCLKEKGKSKNITMHTEKKIYPCISFYKAVDSCTGQKEKAYSIIEQYFTENSKEINAKLQKLCKIPLVYKLVPRIMASVIHKSFGVKSGFKMIDYKTKSDECHIDMIQCPYNFTCTDCGCPELTTVFCNADDISYGNMHQKLSWDRSKTLGRGNECCNFILTIRK